MYSSAKGIADHYRPWAIFCTINRYSFILPSTKYKGEVREANKHDDNDDRDNGGQVDKRIRGSHDEPNVFMKRRRRRWRRRRMESKFDLMQERLHG